MKCNTITECQGGKHLIFNIDLRTEQPVRLGKIAKEIIPLNDRIGERHISINLTYRQDNLTRHINLPAFVSETIQERILNIAFPDDTSVSIRQAGQTVKINHLSYHIGKTAETITEKSGFRTPEYLNILNINVGDITLEEGIGTDAVIASLQTQVANITNWNKPFEIRFVEPDPANYAVGQITNIDRDLDSQPFIWIELRLPEILKDVLKKEFVSISITPKTGSPANILVDSYDLPNRDILFLYRNSEGFSEDPRWPDYTVSSWKNFSNEISRQHKPVAFMHTPSSGQYLPVHYHFNYDPETSGIVDGTMDISYYRETGGQLQLWVERLTFNHDISTGSDPKIIRYALGAPLPEPENEQL